MNLSQNYNLTPTTQNLISIVLVNYNSSSYTIKCVQSIKNHLTNISHEIIIIDNNSDDDQIMALSTLNSIPKLKIIYSKRNVGFGSGNNLSRKIVTGSYILFLNNDTALLDASLILGVVYLEENANVGIIGANLLTDNLLPNYSYGQTPLLATTIKLLMNGIPFRKKTTLVCKCEETMKQPFQVAFPSGAFMLMRKRDLDSIDWFNEKFFMYFEEADITLRLKKILNKKAVLIPTIKVIHLEGASSAGRSDFLRKVYFQSWATLSINHMGKILATIHGVMILLYYLKCIVISVLKHDIQNAAQSRYQLKFIRWFFKKVFS